MRIGPLVRRVVPCLVFALTSVAGVSVGFGEPEDGEPTIGQQLIEVRYERPGASRIAIVGPTITRTDWLCGRDGGVHADHACRDPSPHTRSWGMTGEQRDMLARVLASSGFVGTDGKEPPSGGDRRDDRAAIMVRIVESNGIQQITHVAPSRPDSADSFAVVERALTALVPPPQFLPPISYVGKLPQRADVQLVLDAAGGYQLTLKIPARRNRPTGGAKESGRWQFDPGASLLHLTPTGAAAPVRTAQLTGGPGMGANLELRGYFPVGTTVSLVAESR